MSSGNLPFGFGPGSGGGDPSGLFGELQRLLSGDGGPVNWELAKQLAVQGLAGDNPDVPAAERTSTADAVRLADLWLDEVTELPSGVQSTETWTRLQWLERTLPVWSTLCDPVAARVVAAMSSAIPAEQLAAMGAGNPLAGIMNQVGGLMFGAQVGQGIGALAREVVSATDIGIPLGPEGVAALVPENVAEFGEGLQRPAEEVRLHKVVGVLFAARPVFPRNSNEAFAQGFHQPIEQRLLAFEHQLARFGKAHPARRVDFGKGDHGSALRRPFDLERVADERGGVEIPLGGERGHYDLAAGGDATQYIRGLELCASRAGMLPEQVWTLPDLPEKHMFFGHSTGAARPLVWAQDGEWLLGFDGSYSSDSMLRIESAADGFILREERLAETQTKRYP